MSLDLLLLAALASACVAVGTVSPVAALVLFSLGCVGLWYFLGEA
jgi:hypothetical protein